MLRFLLQAAQNRLAFRYPKTLIRQRKREREGTRRHFLTAGAMTDSREQRWARYLHTHAPAAAAAAPPTQAAGIPIPPKSDRIITKDELRRLGPDQAYQVVIEEDGLEAYQWFVELYPDHSFAAQIWQIIEKESSGNPHAINLWDSNAQKGTPSKGLMQCIDSTFNAHKLPGHDDIWNPVDNIIAGVRYTFSRYGGFEGHPGLKAMAQGGGYQGY